MSVPVQSHPHHILVAVHEAPKSVRPTVRAFFQSCHMGYYEGLATWLFYLFKLIFEPLKLLARIIAIFQEIDIICIAGTGI